MNDLLYTQGQDNLAGIVDKILICPVDDILTLPALTSAASLKTAATAITCKTGKQFHQVYMTDESGKVETKSVGERDGKSRETMLTFRYPALGQPVADFISDVQNTPVVVIYRSGKDGKYFMLGVSRLDKTATALSTSIPAYFESADASTGDKRSSANGANLGWKFGCAHDPIEYDGSVSTILSPGA